MSAPSVNSTCPVPSKGEPLGGRLGGQPQGEEAELETGQVNQEVGSVCDDSKTPRNVATWGVHSITRGEDIMPHTGFPTHNGKLAWKGRLGTLVWGTTRFVCANPSWWNVTDPQSIRRDISMDPIHVFFPIWQVKKQRPREWVGFEHVEMNV